MRISTFLIIGILALFVIAGCDQTTEESTEKVVENGDTVLFDYAAGFSNGTIFDTSLENVAREAGIYNPNRQYAAQNVVMGEAALIPGVSQALLGMEEGGSKSVVIPPERAYGQKIENSTNVVSLEFFQEPEKLVEGQMVVIATPEGDRFPVFVKEINEENVTIDQNHPLAGETLQFALIVRGIEKAE